MNDFCKKKESDWIYNFTIYSIRYLHKYCAHKHNVFVTNTLFFVFNVYIIIIHKSNIYDSAANALDNSEDILRKVFLESKKKRKKKENR